MATTLFKIFINTFVKPYYNIGLMRNPMSLGQFEIDSGIATKYGTIFIRPLFC